MKVGFCVLAAVFAAASAIISQPLSCVHPDICAPRGESIIALLSVWSVSVNW